MRPRDVQTRRASDWLYIEPLPILALASTSTNLPLTPSLLGLANRYPSNAAVYYGKQAMLPIELAGANNCLCERAVPHWSHGCPSPIPARGRYLVNVPNCRVRVEKGETTSALRMGPASH